MQKQLYKCISCGTFYKENSLAEYTNEYICPKDGSTLVLVDEKTREKLLSLYTKEELWNMLEEIRAKKNVINKNEYR